MQRFLKISHLQVRASEWSIARVYQTYETGQALPWLSTVDFVADGLSLARINAFPLRHHEPYSCRGTDLKGFCASYLPNVKEVGLTRTTNLPLVLYDRKEAEHTAGSSSVQLSDLWDRRHGVVTAL